jgi:hypothetical protein
MEYLVRDTYFRMGKKIVMCPSNMDKMIIKATNPLVEWIKFNTSDFKMHSDSIKIVNDNRIYYSMNNGQIWQVCGRAADMNGYIIPDCYEVRQIGIVLL